MRMESQAVGSPAGGVMYLEVAMKTNPTLYFPRLSADSLLSFKPTGEADDPDTICSEWNYGNGYEALQSRELQWQKINVTFARVRNGIRRTKRRVLVSVVDL